MLYNPFPALQSPCTSSFTVMPANACASCLPPWFGKGAKSCQELTTLLPPLSLFFLPNAQLLWRLRFSGSRSTTLRGYCLLWAPNIAVLNSAYEPIKTTPQHCADKRQTRVGDYEKGRGVWGFLRRRWCLFLARATCNRELQDRTTQRTFIFY